MSVIDDLIGAPAACDDRIFPDGQILVGDARDRLRDLTDQSVHCCVTSPPYFGLRDYGSEGQMGLEATPDAFVAGMVDLFREVRRVLRDDGTLWLNLGDSYAGSWGARGRGSSTNAARPDLEAKHGTTAPGRRGFADIGVKPKDLIGIPWRVAFALQADGWYLRQDIIWSKPNPMPESVRDRCTKAHEYIFMLTKRPKYFYDHEAIKNAPHPDLITQVEQGYSGSDSKDFAAGGAQSASGTKARIIEQARKKIDKQRGHGRRHAGFNDRWDSLTRDEQMMLGSNKRSVWTVSPKPFKEAHFATYPPDLIEPCVKAGSPAGGTVLDPFFGAGTTGLVARRNARRFVGVELNPDYATIAERRIGKAAALADLL